MDVDHRKTPGACNPRPSDKEEEDKLDRVTADLADGFYKIYQEIENDMTIASLIWPDMQLRPNDSFFINMVPTETRAAPNSDFYFKLTRQHGVKNGFTIVPASSRIPESVPASGTTTFIDKNMVSVRRSFKYPVWLIQCFQSTITRDRKDENKITTINRFQILKLEVGSTRRWISARMPFDNILIRLEPLGSAVTDNQLFQLIRVDEKVLD